VHALDFIKSIDGDNITLPQVILIGPGKGGFNTDPFEPLLAERATQSIIQKYVDPSMRDLCLSIYYADETSPGEIAMEAQTLPFLVERRVVVVRNAERYYQMSGEKRSPLAALLYYLKSPNPSTLLVLVSAKVDKRVKFHKACLDAGLHIECPQLTDSQLKSWVRNEAGSRGKKIDANAVDILLERTGHRLGDVVNSIGLVASYVGNNNEIKIADVNAACADVAEETVWNMTDAIAESNTASALQALYQLLQYGKSPDEIMGTINWLLESAYKACPESSLNNKSQFVTNNVTPLVRKWGIAKIIDALALSTDTHFMIRSTGVDQKLALELLVLKLAAPRKRAKTASN